ncbi:MAG: outer membrane beta-barrel protein [Myxococcota bacterium]
MRTLWLTTTLLLALAAAAPASAQKARGPQQQVAGTLVLGFGGEAEISGDGGSVSFDLDPTVGLGLRYQVPLSRRLSLGGLFEFRSFEEDQSTDRQSVLDFDLFVKASFGVVLGSKDVELYGLVPLGLSIGPTDDDLDRLGASTGFGFNLGLLAGVQLLVTERVGLFVEMGWRRHQVFYDSDLGDVDVTANQFAMNLGAAYVL